MIHASNGPNSPSFTRATASTMASLADSATRVPIKHGASAMAIAVDATEILLEPSSTAKQTAAATTLPSLPLPKVGPHNFEKIRILGAGSTGRVYLVRSIGLGEEAYYAMKVVKKSELIKRNRVHRILTERQILSVANHPFVVTLHYTFQTADFFYLVMQYCAGGELFSFLRSQVNHRVCEAHARFYAAEVLIALEYLHLLGIIYRDLKPENILVHESGHVMLSDFDLAHEVRHSVTTTDRTSSISSVQSSTSPKKTRLSKRRAPPLSPTISTTDPALWERMRQRQVSNRNVVTVATPGDSGVSSPPGSPPPSSPSKPSTRPRRFSCPCLCIGGAGYPQVDTEAHMEDGEKRTSFVGTHEYVAPEIIAEEGYVGSVDWWAFGILLYEMLFATTPFRGQTQIQTLENILDISEEIEFPPNVPVSSECKDLIQQLLAKNVAHRLQNPLHIKSHPFFHGLVWPLIRHQQPPIIPAMVHSLEEKSFSADELSEFDDEVPYHRALGSPSRKRSTGSTTSSPVPSPTARKLVEMTTEPQPYPLLPRTASGSAVRTASFKGASPTKEETGGSFVSKLSPSRSASFKVHVEATHTPLRSVRSSPPTSPMLLGSSSPQQPSAVHDFEFTATQQRNYWSSRNSHHSLSMKLSQLDLSVLAQDENRIDEQRWPDTELDEGEAVEGEDDDEGDEQAEVMVE